MNQIIKNVLNEGILLCAVLSIVAILIMAPTHAQSDKAFGDNLKVISDFAESICDEVKLDGSTNELSVSAKLEVSALLKKLVGIEAGLDGGGQSKQWQGVMQKDLAALIQNRTECKLSVLAYFKNTLEKIQFEATKPGENAQGQTTEKGAYKEPLLRGRFLSDAIYTGKNPIEVSADYDADGIDETLRIAPGHPNGVDVTYLDGEVGVSLYENFPVNSGFDDFGELEKDRYLHVAAKDVTRDGIPDLLFAIGDGLDNSHLTIMKFKRLVHDPNSRIQYWPELETVFDIDGQEFFDIQEGGYIEVPYGSKGLAFIYRWAGASFVDATEQSSVNQ